FGQRRKALLSRLRKVHPLAAEALSDAGVDSTARPEVVPAALWLAAAEADSMGRSSFSEA
ncbi:MAG: 16S rRNA (adenine(1518)-N(6)/adenine(1519)-N(6))-dimethyltransferase, partial [Planctomycetes bacterium]|nr:16S rRNA (adenine(1518)-N(6)/adenine(1519)-N(6))-dimethyltransferase [Planctomycetota bacterium]